MEQELGIEQRVYRSTIQEVKASAATQTRSDVEDPCVICLEQIRDPAIAQPCQHQNFDLICLVSWLQERSACPLCNSAVTEVTYDVAAETPRSFKTLKVPHLIKPLVTPPSPSGTRTPHVYRGGRRRSRSRPREYAAPPSTTSAALERRRFVYRNQLFSLHVGSNRLSRFQDLTPRQFQTDVELLSRARKWIRRELQVFDFLNPGAESSNNTTVVRRANNAEFLLEYIIAILKTIDVKGALGQGEDILADFLGREHTALFLHELRAWLRSPYTSLEDWDRAVQYSEPFPKDTSNGQGSFRDHDTHVRHSGGSNGGGGQSVGAGADARRLDSLQNHPVQVDHRRHPYARGERHVQRVSELAMRRWRPD